MTRWALVVMATGAAVVYAHWIYRSVEVPARGRVWLRGLRATALVLVALLLVNPEVPGGAASLGEPWVLLDASISMSARGETGSAWEAASARAAELAADGWRVVTFGSRIRGADLLEGLSPSDRETRLAPALTNAAEAGAREVVVLSDLRLEDEISVRAVMDALRLPVRFERFGATVRNVGVIGFEVPDRPDTTRRVAAQFDVYGGGSEDSIEVRVLEEGQVVGQLRVQAPGPGLRRRAEIELPPSPERGVVRYLLERIGPADSYEGDDRAVAYARTGLPDEGGVVVVVLRGGWEGRYLLPTLERVTGLPGSGYLRAGADRFVPMGRGLDRGGAVDSLAVRTAAEAATLLVVLGLSGEVDPWGIALPRAARRRVLFLEDAAAGASIGIPVSAPRFGEWYVSPDVPPSPIAGALAGVVHGGLPPLSSVMAPVDLRGWIVPLRVGVRGGGADQGALFLRDSEIGREVLVPIRGFWRWAMRDAGRPAYEALWASLSDWLLADPARAVTEAGPVRHVMPAGEPVGWRVPVGEEEGRRRIRVYGSDDAPVLDTIFRRGGVVYSVPLERDTYRYRVDGPDGDSLAGGRFDVVPGSGDLVPSAADPAALLAGSPSTSGGAGTVSENGPFRTRSWPYILLILVLCAEWIGRRRTGLR